MASTTSTVTIYTCDECSKAIEFPLRARLDGYANSKKFQAAADLCSHACIGTWSEKVLDNAGYVTPVQPE